MERDGEGYEYDDDHTFDYMDEGDDWLGFTDEDCGRWRNGVLVDHCLLAGTEDCDWECPLRGKPSTGTE